MSEEENKPEEVLYYMENGFMVFTEAFHLKRGYCCTNGCRHCPYKKPTGERGQGALTDKDNTGA